MGERKWESEGREKKEKRTLEDKGSRLENNERKKKKGMV